MFLKPTELVPGRWYIDTTGEECVAVRHREYSSLSDQECELLVVFPRSGNAIPPHLLGTLQFVERPTRIEREPERLADRPPVLGRGR